MMSSREKQQGDSSSSSGSREGEGKRLYNPYEFIGDQTNHFHLANAPEFLFPEEAEFQRRSVGENIQYYTGCGYLGGAFAGGLKGSIDGLRSSEKDDTTKLRVNRVLNSSGHTGRTLGNKVGILGLLYAGVESGIWSLRGGDDLLNPVLSGLATGALYKAAAGPRTAAIAGALGGIAAGGLVGGKHLVKRYFKPL